MPLNKDRLKNRIIAVIEKCQKENDNPDASKINFAEELASAVVEEIKQSKIIYINGLVAPSGGGMVTGEFKCEIQ